MSTEPTYKSISRQGYWQLTERGEEILKARRSLLEYIIDQRFAYTFEKEALGNNVGQMLDPKEQVNLYDETAIEDDIVVWEGKARSGQRRIYERSSRLRKEAIKYFSRDGYISCQVCNFDFSKVYGKHGKGFIEIHHLKPIFQYGQDDIEKTLAYALQNVVPLCSNCHRMVHRRSGRMLSIEELKQIIQNQM